MQIFYNLHVCCYSVASTKIVGDKKLLDVVAAGVVVVVDDDCFTLVGFAFYFSRFINLKQRTAYTVFRIQTEYRLCYNRCKLLLGFCERVFPERNRVCYLPVP